MELNLLRLQACCERNDLTSPLGDEVAAFLILTQLHVVIL